MLKKVFSWAKTFKNYFIPAAFYIIMPPYGIEIMNDIHTSMLPSATEKLIPFSVQCQIKNKK